MIETHNLRRTFASRGKRGKVEAVRGIDFQVLRGEIFGLLGPNGAGKTTTMRMLCTLLIPTTGSVTIAGHSLSHQHLEIRKRIGYVSQVGGMQREATGRENLMLQAKLYGMTVAEATARVEELLTLLNLHEFADRKTSTYSGGQRRIFDLACGIVHRPELLFLDEPSTGLDPQNRAQVWEQVKKLRDQGTTIFVTTHYLEEADALCDRVAIVDHGIIVAMGTPAELKKTIGEDSITLEFADSTQAQYVSMLLEGSPLVRSHTLEERTVRLYVDHGDATLPTILDLLHQQNRPVARIALAHPTLDDVFLKLTGRTLEASEAR
ncbi:MAG TPA: ATP-binding cassette domain-containing protein [Candidatus Paceibacterota bacterium]|nr:ATP-binding cassette domain-containing protein [Candidatus Paceibacterota bacterium]